MPAIDFRKLVIAEKQNRRRAAGHDVDNVNVGGEEEQDLNIMATALAKSRENLTEARIVNQASLDIPYESKVVDLKKFALGGKPSGIHYVPEYISEEMEGRILELVDSLPDNHPQWVQVRGRRLQCYGGQPTDNFKAEPLPVWVQELSNELAKSGIFPENLIPTHVLLNEYRPGQGIMAHTDGPFYESKVAILSLGAPVLFNFKPRPVLDQVGDSVQNGAIASVVLQPRSLIFFTEEAYADYMHEILAVKEEIVGQVKGVDVPVLNLETSGTKLGDKIERQWRASMTFRCVKQTK